jgi:hypothetical protein
MKAPPPYLHITKAGKKPLFTPEKTLWNDTKPTLLNAPLSKTSSSSRRPYRVPINYFVTVHQTIEASSLEDAMLKAQAVEAPDIWVDGFPDEEMTVESEVLPYQVEEVE